MSTLEPATGGPAIVAERLSKTYRVQKKPPGLLGSARALFRRAYTDVRAVQDVSFAVERGELVGFLGPNGAGKTTTLKMLAGLLEPSGGECRVLGYEPFKRERAFQRRFALVLGQKNQLWWDLPAIESFLLNKEIYGLDERQYRATLDELVDLLGLGALLDVQVRKLSLGERMKCELVGALLHRPEVLFLDEPTIGLDVVAQQTIREFLKAYNARHGSTIVLTSHYMEDVKALCERVVVIDHGRLIYDGGLRDLVQRFADTKALTVELERPAAREALAEIGDVLAWDGRTATIRVPREEVSGRAARLLARFPVLDLAIQETDVDEVIRALFSGKALTPGALTPTPEASSRRPPSDAVGAIGTSPHAGWSGRVLTRTPHAAWPLPRASLCEGEGEDARPRDAAGEGEHAPGNPRRDAANGEAGAVAAPGSTAEARRDGPEAG